MRAIFWLTSTKSSQTRNKKQPSLRAVLITYLDSKKPYQASQQRHRQDVVPNNLLGLGCACDCS